MPYLWSKCGWLSVRIPLGYQSITTAMFMGSGLSKFSFPFLPFRFLNGYRTLAEGRKTSADISARTKKYQLPTVNYYNAFPMTL
jgi:hypothetical protein